MRLYSVLEEHGVSLLDDRDGEDPGHLVDVDAYVGRIREIMAGLDRVVDHDLIEDLRALLRRGRHGEHVYQKEQT